MKKYLPHAFAVLLGAAAAFTAPWEGETTTAIIPTKGDVPTICNGETHGVYMGMTATHEQCVEMLKTRMGGTFNQLFSVVKVDLTDQQAVAFADFIYNEGFGNFKYGSHDRPPILPPINAGHIREACKALLEYDVLVRCRDRKIESTCVKTHLQGLTRRREAEFDLCMEGMGL